LKLRKELGLVPPMNEETTLVAGGRS